MPKVVQGMVPSAAEAAFSEQCKSSLAAFICAELEWQNKTTGPLKCANHNDNGLNVIVL